MNLGLSHTGDLRFLPYVSGIWFCGFPCQPLPWGFLFPPQSVLWLQFQMRPPQSKSSPFSFPCLPLALCLGLKCEIRKNARLSMLSHKLDNPPVCCSPRSFHNLSGKFLLLPSMPLIRYLLLCVPSFRLLAVAFGYIIVTAVHLVNTFLLPPVTFLLIFVSYRAML